MPEWCEKGVLANPHDCELICFCKGDGTWFSVRSLGGSAIEKIKRINSGLAALRADRDQWRENTTGLIADRKMAEDQHDLRLAECQELRRRVKELEAAQARQMVTIDTLTAQLNEARKACEMWANQCKPKPADDWRERCRVVETKPEYFDITSPTGKYEWWERSGWRRRETYSGYFTTHEAARTALATIPTPPPDAAEGATR